MPVPCSAGCGLKVTTNTRHRSERLLGKQAPSATKTHPFHFPTAAPSATKSTIETHTKIVPESTYAYLLDLSSGTEGGKGGQGGGGLGARLEGRVHHERELGHLLHAVTASHDERGHRSCGERRRHGVTLLVHVDVAVPDRAQERGGGGEGRNDKNSFFL